MRLKVEPLEIDPDDPFGNDALDRRESAEILTTFVQSLEASAVLAIDSPWGTGKSTFIKMWNAHLKLEGFPTLYFNAWESDFTDDALVALISEIEAAMAELRGRDDAVQEKARQSLGLLRKHGGKLIKRGLPALIRILSSGLINIPDKDLDDAVGSAVGDAGAEYVEELFDDYEKSKEAFQEFKKSLQEFVEFVQSIKGNSNPLVFFIDELDRCRPNYAIEVLEKAKHLFAIPGIVFVLALDKEQLGHSIRSVYGTGMNVDGYLMRFIDFDYLLPPSQTDIFLRELYTRHGFRFGHRQMDTLPDAMDHWTRVFSPTLRQVQRVVSELAVILRSTSPDEPILARPSIFLLYMRQCDREMYELVRRLPPANHLIPHACTTAA